ncbi:MAG: CBS domain-containing protein [Chloroflexi bacterium]|nr:CBS domain-containing protein [Chloroflexota bacterium]
MKNLFVKDWMEVDVMTVEPKTRMLEAHQLMRSNKIRRVPVIHRGKVVGIITRSDVREAEPSDATSLNVWEINYLLNKLTVKDIMTKDVQTVSPDDTVKTAATLMHQLKIGALPVVNEKAGLVGILTESDIFRVLIAWFNEEVGEG